MTRRRSLICFLVFAALAGGGFVAAQRSRVQPGVQPDGSVIVTSNQRLTPVGLVRQVAPARPKDLALSPDGKTLAVLCTSRVAFFDADGSPRGEVPLTAGALGIAWAPDGNTVFASGTSVVHRLTREAGNWKVAGNFTVEAPGPQGGRGRAPANPQPNGLAVSPNGERLYVALGIRNAVAVVELPELRVSATAPVGVAPYALALSADGRTLAVANRGGERVEGNEAQTATSAGTALRIDPETDAARRGSVSLLDTQTLTPAHVDVGRQPSGLSFSPDGRRLYVANSDDDTLAVVDARGKKVLTRLSLRPAEDPGFGQIPTDVAVSADGKTLYATCGGGNAVAVIDAAGAPKVSGYFGAGWFPIGVAERDGRVFVISSKGLGARQPNAQGKFGVHATTGTVQFVAADDRKALPALTRQVARNNQWGPEPPARRGVAAVPIPERVGEPSFFKHVVYIIKENHTYDLTLGDIPEGNGDRSLTLFGEDVTPNQHALARGWVLLDNTYTSGTNSADGHQWTDSAIGNGYIEQNYGAHARSYPYDGGDPLAYSPEGFLWTAAAKKGLSLRVYGEFVNRPRIRDRMGEKPATWTELWKDYQAGGDRFEIAAETDNAALRPFLHPRFIGFPSTVSDQWRADQFLADLKAWEGDGKMPNLSILLLPNDHTAGTRPGMPTPRAAVADNDLATGRIIDALSHSRFWKETLVLVIEDDSQLGVDHVDGHRTIAFCVSPYTRRGAVVSEAYNHTSVLRTIELVLGLPAMTRFDRTATPMTACFTPQPDYRPFTHLKNRIPLDEMNPPARALRGEARRLAEACDRLDWSDVDRANADVVARSVWHSVRGSERFPAEHFHAYVDADDDD